VSRRPRLDVIIGAFGSGKTTLIRKVLRARPVPASIVLNDLVGIDLEVEALREIADPVATVMGGCVCCERRPAFRDALESVLDHGDRHGMPQRIVLECAGSARLEDVLDLVRRDVLTVNRIRLGRLVHTLDCQAGMEGSASDALAAVPREVDLVVLTKTDLVPESVVRTFEDRIREVGPGIQTFRMGGAETVDGIASAWLDPERGGRTVGGSAETTWSARPPGGETHPARPGLGATGPRSGRSAYDLVDVTWCGEADWARLGVWLSLFFAVHGDAVHRLKGEIVVRGRPVLLNAVGPTMYVPEVLEPDPAAPARPSRIVIVLDESALDARALERSLREAAISRPGRATGGA